MSTLRGLALRRLAGQALEDAAAPLAAGCFSCQKLEGVGLFGLHAQRCIIATILQ